MIKLFATKHNDIKQAVLDSDNQINNWRDKLTFSIEIKNTSLNYGNTNIKKSFRK